MKNQQRATTFMPGTFSQVCREIGFKYGYALVEGYQQLPIITMAIARLAIKELVSREIINPDQAQGLTDAIAKAGVAEDAAAIIKMAKQIKQPRDFEPQFEFVICTEHQDERDPSPFSHGHLWWRSGRLIEGTFSTQEAVINWVAGVDASQIDDFVPSAAAMIAGLATIDLPRDPEDKAAQFAALPVELRDDISAYKRLRREEEAAQTIELPEFVVRQLASRFFGI